MKHRERLASARVARLATVGRTGAPHIVPITFATDGERIVTGIDHKPKRSERLQRLSNIAADPRVAVLADHYQEDWSRLWWVRADGIAAVVDPGEAGHDEACELLAAKYDAYRLHPISGPVIDIRVARWSGWSAADDS
ncbi:MAG TPA: TIGR03668 family PPOX class F420-dependent oxidoreductase [Acidimicrobiia bacterium]|nr:TIGR03668 family PPOX class F420-dependent oxidoreductase [Acidimicrobiia bacterium]